MAKRPEGVNDDWLKARFSWSQPEEEPPREVLHLLGLEDAVLGIAYRAGNIPVLAYDYDACIEKLMEMGASAMAALEMVENSLGVPMGEETPVIVKRMPFGEALEILEEG